MNSSKDAVATLGTILDETAARDAIHVAVEPVIAAHRLRPGQRIGRLAGAWGESPSPLGVVDPFLERDVKKGERFFMFLLPRTITGLRHVWEHPEFRGETDSPPVSRKELAKAWLLDYVAGQSLDLDDLLYYAKEWLDEPEGSWGGYYVEQGSSSLRDNWKPEFWKYYEDYTGESVPDSKRESFFSCSC